MNRYVGIFQSAEDGSGYAYFVEADDHGKASSLISSHFECEFGTEVGEVMCYTPEQLREMADKLESTDTNLDIPTSNNLVKEPDISERVFSILSGSESSPQWRPKKGWATKLIGCDTREDGIWTFTHLHTGRRIFSAQATDLQARNIALELSLIRSFKSGTRTGVTLSFEDWASPKSIDSKFQEICSSYGAVLHVPQVEQLEI